MTALIRLYDSLTHALEATATWLIPTLARLVFAGTLLVYYWNSGMTKLGEGIGGIINLDFGAYIQILPRVFDAVGYDPSQLGLFARLITIAGTWAEFILPALIVLGLMTRLAALGMIGFVIVQSYVDIVGHGLGGADIGGWFDGTPSALIVDQRAFWVFLLLVLALRGGGPLALDALLRRQVSAPATSLPQPR